MRRQRGFTLVELLVVVGILALLIALLMPALRMAREQSRSVVCASNMRQIYTAVSAYATDNEEFLPAPPWIWDTTGSAPAICAWTMIDIGITDFSNGPIWKYFGGQENRQRVFNCPSDLAERPKVGAVVNVVRNFSYSLNAGINWDPIGQQTDWHHTYPPLRITRIKHLGEKILVWEEVGPNDGCCVCIYEDHDDYPASRHLRWGKGLSADNGGRGRGNQVFADGHLEMVEPERYFRNPRYCDLLN